MDLLLHKNLFEASEKGSREWKAFNVVRDDVVDAYKVSMPRITDPRALPYEVERLLVLKGAG